MKVLIKRSIKKDGNPRSEEIMTMPEVLCESKGEKLFGYFYEKQGKKFCESEETLLEDITHWYEEIELSKLLEEVMPTEDTMQREANKLSIENFEEWDTCDAIYNGMKWLKSKLSN